MDLVAIFDKINAAHFDGFLEPPALKWNGRLRSSAGRFIPGKRMFIGRFPPVIEVASYLLTEVESAKLVEDTIAHEMIHYWLWVRRRPYGHTPDFLTKMRTMGVSRYNPVPRSRPFRYIYRCPACSKDFFARKRLGVLACAGCCKTHAKGRYDVRFKLALHRQLDRAEGIELARQRSAPT